MRVAAPLAVGLLSLTIGSASAATMVVSGTMALTAVPSGGLSQTVFIDKFNVTDATLTGISIDFTGNVSGTVSFARTQMGTANPITYTTHLGSDFTLALGVATLLSLPNVYTGDFTAALVKNGSAASGTLTGTGSAVSLVSSSLFSQFTGVGSLDLGLQILRDNAFTSPNTPPTVTYMNNASVALQVTYTYSLASPATGVPEPMSLAMFGVGLLGLVAVGRHLRRT